MRALMHILMALVLATSVAAQGAYQSTIEGDVAGPVGPVTATAVVCFPGTDGNTIDECGGPVTVDSSGNVDTPGTITASGLSVTHATTHEDGGSDEVSVAGLSGLLGDAQTPTTHAASHAENGSDELLIENLGTSVGSNFLYKSDATGGVVATGITVDSSDNLILPNASFVDLGDDTSLKSQVFRFETSNSVDGLFYENGGGVRALTNKELTPSMLLFLNTGGARFTALQFSTSLNPLTSGLLIGTNNLGVGSLTIDDLATFTTPLSSNLHTLSIYGGTASDTGGKPDSLAFRNSDGVAHVSYDVPADGTQNFGADTWTHVEATDTLTWSGTLAATQATLEVFGSGPSTELVIATGAVTLTKGFHTIDTESGDAADDLDSATIPADWFDGYRVVLMAEDAARTVTIKDGSVFKLPADCVLDSAEDTFEGMVVGSTIVQLNCNDNAP